MMQVTSPALEKFGKGITEKVSLQTTAESL